MIPKEVFFQKLAILGVIPNTITEESKMEERKRGALKKEFLVKLHGGKEHCLFAGLLDLGHQEGLSNVTTTILQIPCKENGMMAVVHARVTTAFGDFTGIGDADPTNVNKMMVNHILRMGETRSIARALRFATNIGVAAIEEMRDINDIHDEDAQDNHVSQVQLKPIFDLAHKAGITNKQLDDMCETKWRVSADNLTPSQATALIKDISAMIATSREDGNEEEKKVDASRKIPNNWIKGLRDKEIKLGMDNDKHAENSRVKHGYPRILSAFTIAEGSKYKKELDDRIASQEESETDSPQEIEQPTRIGG